MDGNNGFFQLSDTRASHIGGMELHPEWWSRPYEYAWALNYLPAKKFIAADMGAGYHLRPFRLLLEQRCSKVYAVDVNPEILLQPASNRTRFVVADFTRKIPAIRAGSVDRIFCISVLEDITDIAGALGEFQRILKKDGRVMITFDTPYNLRLPCPKYKGLPVTDFLHGLAKTKLVLDGSVRGIINENTVNHIGWNLCVFHCVLRYGR